MSNIRICRNKINKNQDSQDGKINRIKSKIKTHNEVKIISGFTGFRD